RRQAEEEVAAETEKAKRDVNKTLSADQLHIRRKLSRKNLELQEKLFKEVREKLTAYKKDPSYEEYLERKIR
ncbi:Archaeal/vacuolar-type H+-ATPase subunit E, partial [Blautia wexlerae]|nr:Archaeal/vacuolar-type H+-ATPase subunit E [Blautia wexlerae]